ncbi:Poly(A) polymerase gamma, partial [Stegodyphus mimosarum]
MGLKFSQAEKIKINLTSEVQIFTDTIMLKAVRANLFKSGMKVEAKPICRKDLHLYLPRERSSRKKKRKERA